MTRNTINGVADSSLDQMMLKSSKISGPEAIIQNLEKQKDFMSKMLMLQSKTFIPGSDSDISDAMNKTQECMMNMSKVDTQINEMKFRLNESAENKSKKYEGKEVSYNGSQRKSTYKNGKVDFAYNIDTKKLPDGYENLVAIVNVKGKYNKKPLYQARIEGEKIKDGQNEFTFNASDIKETPGSHSSRMKFLEGDEYTISVDLEYDLGGSKEIATDISDYTEKVIGVDKDFKLILTSKKSISVDDVKSSSNSSNYSGNDNESDSSKVFAWEAILGKTVSAKKDGKSVEGVVVSVSKDPKTKKMSVVDLKDKTGNIHSCKITNIDKVIDESQTQDTQGYSKDYHLMQQGKEYLDSNVSLEYDNFEYNGNEVKFHNIGLPIDENFDENLDFAVKLEVYDLKTGDLVAEVQNQDTYYKRFSLDGRTGADLDEHEKEFVIKILKNVGEIASDTIARNMLMADFGGYKNDVENELSKFFDDQERKIKENNHSIIWDGKGKNGNKVDVGDYEFRLFHRVGNDPDFTDVEVQYHVDTYEINKGEDENKELVLRANNLYAFGQTISFSPEFVTSIKKQAGVSIRSVV